MTDAYDPAKSLDLLARLERRGLDKVTSFDDRVASELLSRRAWSPRDLEFHRLRRLLRRSDRVDRLGDELLGLLGVLHGSSAPFVVALLSRDGGLGVFVGSATTRIASDALRSVVEASFPSADIEPCRGDHLAGAVGGLTRCSCMIGAPPQESPGVIASVSEGLGGVPGAVIAVAVPVSIVEAASCTTTLLQEVVAASPFIKTNQALQQRSRETITSEHPNPALERYVQGLEQCRREIGASADAGLWRLSLVLSAPDPASLARLRALACKAWSRSDASSLAEPLRVIELNGPNLRKAALEFLPLAPLQLPADASGSPLLSTLFGGAITPMAARHLAALCAMPPEEYPGFGVRRRARFQVDPHTAVAPVFTLGEISDLGRSTGIFCKVSREELRKHALVAGVTGSGKTTTCMGLLSQLRNEAPSIPFLVIEPAKREYRRLLGTRGFSELVVFTLGEETCTPIRLNPFEVEPGASVQAHLDLLRAAFQAAFPMYPPMPQVLERCLHEVYADRGWDLIRNERRGGVGTSDDFPTMSDLFAKIDPVVDGMGYESRITQDVKAAMRARIGSLRLGGKGSLLDCWRSTPMTELLARPVVIELEAIADDEEKAFVLGLILVRLYEHRIAAVRQGTTASELRHVTLFEEAHRLLARTMDQSGNPDAVNTKAKAVEVFAKILSEIRAYGEAIVVSEQIPAKLATDVIKNTNIKIAHRLVAAEDRELVGTSMKMSPGQREDLAVLRTGDVAVFCEGFDGPYLLRVVSGAAQPAVGDKIVQDVYRKWRVAHEGTLGKYAECYHCPAKCLNPDHAAELRAKPSIHRLTEGVLATLAVAPSTFEDVYRAFRAFVSSVDPVLDADRGRLDDVLGCLFVELGERRFRALTESPDHRGRDPELMSRFSDLVSRLFADRGKMNCDSRTIEAARGFGARYGYLKSLLPAPFDACKQACEHRCLLRSAGAAVASDDELFGRATAVYASDAEDRFPTLQKVVESAVRAATGAAESVVVPVAVCTFVHLCVRAGLDEDDVCWAVSQYPQMTDARRVE